MTDRHAPAGLHDPAAFRLTDDDLHLFNEGTHYRLFEKLGAHPIGRPAAGTAFGVWAPNAEEVSVVGDFNGWHAGRDRLTERGHSGIWEGVVAEATLGQRYKYHLVCRNHGYRVDKADPFAFEAEVPPATASVICAGTHEWMDEAWMQRRGERMALSAPVSIYEVHLGSWMPAADGRPWPTYREVAPRLADYAARHGFTHIEFLPLAEHPFYGSWGYQTTGYFAPTSRYGSPDDFRFLVDYLHRAGIGVILDWVPSHFPSDEHGLAYFDGTHLYEHADRRQGYHPDWNSYIFNYGRHEVRSFLLSSALYWLERFHIDALRVDAVASMLYLDYSRQAGEWIPNRYGGRENLEAIDFLRALNEMTYRECPDVQMIAEESTAWPQVSRPPYVGGLGFGLKWDMGWMHDTLLYFSKNPVHRQFHHYQLTFRLLYAFHENFVLPLSHDEVVHGKGSLIGRMPGDDWQRFANLRLLFAAQFAQPGKKLLFMGGEFGQWREWHHDTSLDWHLTGEPLHGGVQRWVADLNALYRHVPALHVLDCDPGGFEWIDANDSKQSVLTLLRRDGSGRGDVLVALNFTPVPREAYRIGVPSGGFWRERLNSDAVEYGGSGWGNLGGVTASDVGWHGRPHSVEIALPPLGAVFLVHEDR